LEAKTSKRLIFEEEATVSDWDSDYYHPIAVRLYDQLVPDMLKMMGAKPGSTVLDGGCGPGVHSVRAARAGCNVMAIDISETMLGHAKQRVEEAGFGDMVEFAQKDLTNLDLPDESFEHVFSWGVIIHIREIELALENLARIVKPGGSLALYLTSDSAVDHKLESTLRFVTRKPLNLQKLPLGDGVYYDMNDQKLWVWRVNASAVTKYLAEKGFRLTHRRIGECTEIQRRVNGFPRRALLRMNNLAYRFHVPPSLGCTSLFVFKKDA